MVSDPFECRPDALDRRGQITHDKLGLNSEDAIPGARQHGVTLRISPRPLDMISAVDLNHEPLSWRQEVGDKPPEQRHLAPKHDAQLTPTNSAPKKPFGGSRRRPHQPRSRREPVRLLWASVSKQGLVVDSSHAHRGAGAVPAPRQHTHARAWAGAGRAPLWQDSNRQQARAVTRALHTQATQKTAAVGKALPWDPPPRGALWRRARR
jgi:hypothetical protein